MPDILEGSQEIRVKLALMGPPGGGKIDILRSWSEQEGSGPLHHQKVGETDVYRASWKWSGVPESGWSLGLSAYTTAGVVDFNAITEMLLDGVDGIIFVAPVDSNRAEEIRKSLQTVAFNLKRHHRQLGDIPVTMHYHRSELMPGFDPKMLDQFLGIEGGKVPSFVTRSQGDDLTVSFASIVRQVLRGITLPSKPVKS
ncbi:MAG: GTPase domain-containing protein [Verrucomicrobiaceae bacterium]